MAVSVWSAPGSWARSAACIVSRCAGGFTAAISACGGSYGRRHAPLLPARAIMRQQVGYHAERIATYTLLGAVFDAAGAAALQAAELLPI